MKETNTAHRLKEIMDEQNLKQIDILNKAKPICKKYGIKLEKNDLSQYISGKVEPKQDKLSVLAETLDVNEAWLMGYDVPKQNKTSKNDEQENNTLINFLLTVSYDNIQKTVDDDKNNKILSYFSVLELLMFLYPKNDTYYIKEFETEMKKIDKTYIFLDELKKTLYNNSKQIPKSIKKEISKLEVKKEILTIKKTKLILYLRKKYNKEDIIKEIDNRDTFKLKENEKNEKNRLLKIAHNLDEMLDIAMKYSKK